MLRRVGADPAAIAAQIEEEADVEERTDVAPSLSPDAKAALLAAYEESRQIGASYVGPEHVLLALAQDTETEAGELLERFAINHTKLRGAVIRGVESGEVGGRPASTTRTLDEYGRDPDGGGPSGKLDPVIGRADQIEQTIEILSRHWPRTTLCCSATPASARPRSWRASPGGSSTTTCPRRSPASACGARHGGDDRRHEVRGEFEERLKGVIEEITENADSLIVFIDEIHTVTGAGAAEGAMDASSMLKPALARGELHMIGATRSTSTGRTSRRIPRSSGAAARAGLGADRRGDDRDPHRPERPVQGLPSRAHHGGGDRRSVGAVRPIHPRPLPARQGDRPDRPGGRPRPSPVEGQAGGHARAAEEELRRMGRERDQVISAEDYKRADELKAQIDERRASRRGGRKLVRARPRSRSRTS